MEYGIPYHIMPEYQYDEKSPIINTERFSPVANGIDLPNPRDPFHISIDNWPKKQFEDEMLSKYVVDEAWWYRQKERCINGYTVKNARLDGSDVKITGQHYFYLNFWPIYGKAKDSKNNAKTITKPKFTDLDYIIFWRIESMKSLSKDDLFYKSRQKGFSEKAALIVGWNYTFMQSSVNIIIAGSEEDSGQTMNNAIRGLDYLINTQFYKERSKNASDEVWASKFGSKIKQLTAGSDGMQSVSRFSPYWIVYEEVGKWPKGLVRSMKEFVDASLFSEGVKTGFAMYIGTGGDMDTGAADLEKMYYNPAEYDLLEFDDVLEMPHLRQQTKVAGFIPSWMYAIIDSDGNSLKEKSIDFHNKTALTKKDKGARILYSVNHPIYPHQGFMVPTGGYFGEKKQAKLVERKSEILRNRALQITEEGNLYWIDKYDWSKGVYFEPGQDDKGKTSIVITERPKINESTDKPYDNLYKQGTDSYDRDEANTSTSRGSSIVGHGFLDADSPSYYPVARITIRPETWEGGAEAFYEEVVKLNIYYNAINLIEYSNLRIFDYYKNHGLSYLLKERPKLSIAKWINDTKVANDYGIDPQSKPFWLSSLSDQMTDEWINSLYDVDIISALSKFRYEPSKGRYNCDTTISMSLLSVLYDDERELEVQKYQETTRHRFPGVAYKRNGNAFAKI